MTARTSVIVIGAGVGGLAASLHLARNGFDVRVLEARSDAGGLASGVTCNDFAFDAGPYILLDRPGLDWAFDRLGLNLEKLQLRPIHHIYDVETPGGTIVQFHSDLHKTAEGFEKQWRGSGERYTKFVRSMHDVAQALRPMLQTSQPGALGLIRTGAWRHAAFLAKNLGSVLAGADLPAPVADAIAIWTHIAGQRRNEAPSPMAFVPALMHVAGAYYPNGGIRRIPDVLATAATTAGVRFHYGTKVKHIVVQSGRVSGVETDTGDFAPATVLLSNASALDTYLRLLRPPPPAADELKKLPLQSPGVCAYIAARGRPSSTYLRFRLDDDNRRCRLLIQPAVPQGDWFPLRLMAPLDYRQAQTAGPAGQLSYLDELLNEEWWREGLTEVRILAKRTPHQWGVDFNLYENSMNPVMTASFMRKGRIPHRSPYVRGLYLAGSSTHPGQWVSFCMMSGIHAGDCIIEDHR